MLPGIERGMIREAYSGKVVIAVYAATPYGYLRKYDPYNPGMDPYGEIICEDIVYDPNHPLR